MTALSHAEIEAAADALLHARRAREPIQAPAAMLTELDDAYRIQNAVVRKQGTPDGWKVGAKDRGQIPTCAPLLRGTVRLPGNETGATLKTRGARGVEVELAYKLGRDFPPGAVVSEREIIDSIVSAHVAIELCASRLQNDPQPHPLWILADNQLNDGLVVGPPLASWHDLAYATLAARLAVNSETIVSTIGAHGTGDPLALVVWLVMHCMQYRGGVSSGQIVTTGTWTGMPIVTPPAQLSAEFAGVGALSLMLAAC